jgi:hypothetical protein
MFAKGVRTPMCKKCGWKPPSSKACALAELAAHWFQHHPLSTGSPTPQGWQSLAATTLLNHPVTASWFATTEGYHLFKALDATSPTAVDPLAFLRPFEHLVTVGDCLDLPLDIASTEKPISLGPYLVPYDDAARNRALTFWAGFEILPDNVPPAHRQAAKNARSTILQNQFSSDSQSPLSDSALRVISSPPRQHQPKSDENDCSPGSSPPSSDDDPSSPSSDSEDDRGDIPPDPPMMPPRAPKRPMLPYKMRVGTKALSTQLDKYRHQYQVIAGLDETNPHHLSAELRKLATWYLADHIAERHQSVTITFASKREQTFFQNYAPSIATYIHRPMVVPKDLSRGSVNPIDYGNEIPAASSTVAMDVYALPTQALTPETLATFFFPMDVEDRYQHTHYHALFDYSAPCGVVFSEGYWRRRGDIVTSYPDRTQPAFDHDACLWIHKHGYQQLTNGDCLIWSQIKAWHTGTAYTVYRFVVAQTPPTRNPMNVSTSDYHTYKIPYATAFWHHYLPTKWQPTAEVVAPHAAVNAVRRYLDGRARSAFTHGSAVTVFHAAKTAEWNNLVTVFPDLDAGHEPLIVWLSQQQSLTMLQAAPMMSSPVHAHANAVYKAYGTEAERTQTLPVNAIVVAIGAFMIIYTGFRRLGLASLFSPQGCHATCYWIATKLRPLLPTLADWVEAVAATPIVTIFAFCVLSPIMEERIKRMHGFGPILYGAFEAAYHNDTPFQAVRRILMHIMITRRSYVASVGAHAIRNFACMVSTKPLEVAVDCALCPALAPIYFGATVVDTLSQEGNYTAMLASLFVDPRDDCPPTVSPLCSLVKIVQTLPLPRYETLQGVCSRFYHSLEPPMIVPARSASTVFSMIEHRITKPAPVNPHKQTARWMSTMKTFWIPMLHAIVPQHPPIDNTACIPEWLDHFPPGKKQKYVMAVNRLAEVGPDTAIRHAARVEMMPKLNEGIFKRKPRALANVSPLAQVGFGPAVLHAFKRLKTFTNELRVHTHMGKRFTLTIASGFTSDRLDHWLSNIFHLCCDFHIIVSGDDSLVLYWTPQGWVVYEGDWGMCDQSQSVGPLTFEKHALDRLGVQPHECNMIATVEAAEIIVPLKEGVCIRLSLKLRPIRCTGNSNTTSGNSTNVGFTTLGAALLSGPNATRYAKVFRWFGFDMKLRVTTLSHMTFLKGMWFDHSTGPVWAPLPSRVVKILKTTTAIHTVYPRMYRVSPFATAYYHIASVCNGLALYTLPSPLREFVDHHCNRFVPMITPDWQVEAPIRRVTLGPEHKHHLAEHYNVPVHWFDEAAAALCTSVPVDLSHPLFTRLVERDYL